MQKLIRDNKMYQGYLKNGLKVAKEAYLLYLMGRKMKMFLIIN